MEDLDTAPALQPIITGIIRHVQKGTAPTVHSFGFDKFGGNLTTISIFRDQSEIGWTNFLCGRWGVEAGTETTLFEDQVQKITSSVGNCNIKETINASLGYVAVSKYSTTLTDWDHGARQSSHS